MVWEAEQRVGKCADVSSDPSFGPQQPRRTVRRSTSACDQPLLRLLQELGFPGSPSAQVPRLDSAQETLT